MNITSCRSQFISPLVSILGSLALALAVGASDSNLEVDQSHSLPMISNFPGGELEIAEEFDADSNGVLDRNERIAARRHVHQVRSEAAVEELMKDDKDGDGKVTKDELPTRQDQGMYFLDQNKDGIIDKDEMQRWPDSKKYDANEDGKLTKEELPDGIHSTMKKYDLNEDGYIEEKEAEEKESNIMRRDRNKDGKVSLAELDRRYATMKEADLNEDGFIDREEAKQGLFRGRGSDDESERSFDDAEKLQTARLPKQAGGLYNTGALRTFFLQIDSEDWLAELNDFRETDILVPADLLVDGELYRDVGIRFRGNSSLWGVRPELKRSLNLSIDHGHSKQRLFGYKTLNLHNATEDPTLMREVLYVGICRDYMPSFKANFVKLVINGESWGIYPNVQQYNADFLQDWYGSREGVRWKISTRGLQGLTYEGTDPKKYEGYLLKSGNAPENALDDLIDLCRVLNHTHDDRLEEALNPIFNINGALWSIALENIFIDEGYLIRTMDYNLFQDVNGRFHLLQHDANEVFNIPHGPGLPPGTDPTTLDPFHQHDNKRRPVVSRLLSIPHLRARYVAYMRTIIDEWLSWEKIGPVVEQYRSLIGPEVEKDVRKTYTFEEFSKGHLEDVHDGGILGLKNFVDKRREFLLAHESIAASAPEIVSVSFPQGQTRPTTGRPVFVRAETSGDTKTQMMMLHWAVDPHAPFKAEPMFDDGRHDDGESEDGVFCGWIPSQEEGVQVYYYLEARSDREQLVTSFYPVKAETGALTYIVRPAGQNESLVVINELMSRNGSTLKDPQGDFDDWIELRNLGDHEIDLTGMYLTDNPKKPRKWAFPAGTRIPVGDFLIVWADEDDHESEGLHANFKLSDDETIQLIDTDDRDNRVLDQVELGGLKPDRALARGSNGSWQEASPSPGKGI